MTCRMQKDENIIFFLRSFRKERFFKKAVSETWCMDSCCLSAIPRKNSSFLSITHFGKLNNKVEISVAWSDSQRYEIEKLHIIRFYDHENTRLLQIDMTEERHETYGIRHDYPIIKAICISGEATLVNNLSVYSNVMEKNISLRFPTPSQLYN